MAGSINLGCIAACTGAFVTKVLIGSVDYTVGDYSDVRVDLRKKVKIALDDYFNKANLPESYQQKVLNTPKFLDVVARKVQLDNADIDFMSKKEFKEAVKKVIGREAVGQIFVDYKGKDAQLNDVKLEELSGLDSSIYKELQKRFGDDRLNIEFNTDAKYKSFILEARKLVPSGTDSSKANDTLAKKLVKGVIFREFDKWYDTTDTAQGGFDSILTIMKEAAVEVVTEAGANVTKDVLKHVGNLEAFREFKDIAALTKELLEQGKDFFEEGEEFFVQGQKFVHKGNQVFDNAGNLIGTIESAANAVENAADNVGSTGVSLHLEANAQVTLAGAVNNFEAEDS